LKPNERGFIGLKGASFSWWLRASIYNAFPKEGIEKLIDFLRYFKAKS